jgi:hypothetical protein
MEAPATTGYNLTALMQSDDYDTNNFNSKEFAFTLRTYGQNGEAPGVHFSLEDDFISQRTDSQTTGLTKQIFEQIRGNLVSIIGTLQHTDDAYEFDCGWHLITGDDRGLDKQTISEAQKLHDLFFNLIQQRFPETKCQNSTTQDELINWTPSVRHNSVTTTKYAPPDKPAGWFDAAWYKIFDGNAPWKLQKYELHLREIVASLKKQQINLGALIEDSPQAHRLLKSLGVSTEELALTQQSIRALLMIEEKDDKPSWGKWAKSFVVSTESTQRDFFRKFIARFRDAWAQSKNNELLCKIGFNLFHNVFIHEYHRQLVNQFIVWGANGVVTNPESSHFTLEQEMEFIRNVNDKHRMPATAKYAVKSYEMFVEMDPMNNGNLPYVLGLLKTSRDNHIAWIRQAVPLIGNRPNAAFTVSPEFKAAVTHMKAIGHKRLYIHLADSQPGPEDESKFFPPLQELANKFPTNFFLVRFDHDTPFAHQSNPSPEEPNCMRAFKAIFIGMLKANSLGGYHFPNTWLDDKNFTKKMEEIVDFVHREFYAEARELVKEERVTFIRLTNTLIAAYLIFVKVQPDSFNFTCRNGRDRAQEESRRMMEFLGLILNKQEDFKFREDKTAATHAASIISNKQQIIDPRKTYLILAVDKKFQEPRVRQGVIKFYNEFIYSEDESIKLVDLIFPRNPQQELWRDEE